VHKNIFTDDIISTSIVSNVQCTRIGYYPGKLTQKHMSEGGLDCKYKRVYVKIKKRIYWSFEISIFYKVMI
jgi:hypothetical protein